MEIYPVQQGSQERLELKRVRVTGTRLKEVMGKKADSLMYEMIAEKYEPVEDYQSSEMSNGVLWEPWAIDKYQEVTGQIVKEVGFITKGEDIGLSPDGLIGEKKAIEVKSPSLKKHIEYIVSNKLPAEYKWQVVHYFLVIDELESLDFVSYNPKFPLKELHIVTVTKADLADEILQAAEKLQAFLKKYNQTLANLL